MLALLARRAPTSAGKRRGPRRRATAAEPHPQIVVGGSHVDPESTRAAVATVAAAGPLDILVCNAGSGASVPPGRETAAEWRRVLDVNFSSATNLIEAARPVMAAGAGDRAIVCISSICGSAALGAPVTYSAAKAALDAMVRGLARPLAAEGIRVLAVAPGNILTEDGTWARKLADDATAVSDMLARDVPLGRLGRPEEDRGSRRVPGLAEGGLRDGNGRRRRRRAAARVNGRDRS